MDKVTFVVDDDEAARNSLIFMLRAEKIRARSFKSAAELFDSLLPEHRGCIVTDVRMPGIDGISLLHELKARNCLMPVIVITGHADVVMAVEAMKAGARDFIEKPFESFRIIRSIVKCMEASEALGKKQDQRALYARRLEALTDRERNIFNFLVQGKSNKDIALELRISSRTVEVHRANVMAKINADNIADLIHINMVASVPVEHLASAIQPLT